jgi:hypothetical protein
LFDNRPQLFLSISSLSPTFLQQPHSQLMHNTIAWDPTVRMTLAPTVSQLLLTAFLLYLIIPNSFLPNTSPCLLPLQALPPVVLLSTKCTVR